jgi:hypothetical protein
MTLPQTEQGLELYSGPKGEMEPSVLDLKSSLYQSAIQGNVKHEVAERLNKVLHSLMGSSRKCGEELIERTDRE